MTENRVVQGRMVTARSLAELIEDESILETDSIVDADRSCPACDGDVLEVGYMPTVTEFVVGRKCQGCDWAETERDPD